MSCSVMNWTCGALGWLRPSSYQVHTHLQYEPQLAEAQGQKSVSTWGNLNPSGEWVWTVLLLLFSDIPSTQGPSWQAEKHIVT